MSNILYSQVDENLQTELNLRGNSGKTRTTDDINFMVSKLANVQLTAYEDNNSDPTKIVKEHGILGGQTVRAGRYLPSSFLSKQDFSSTTVEFVDETNINVVNAARMLSRQSALTDGQAFSQTNNSIDESNRIGPYITSLDISIGDHSMGLLNKATVNISIPNPSRDLDAIEDTWFRPGRYVKIQIAQGDSAILSRNIKDNYGLLKTATIPIKEKLKELYPNWDIDKLETQIRKMNEYSFEGLITKFEFSYQSNGQVDATLSLTGTSNVYTDVSMWMSTPVKKDTAATPKIDTDPIIGVVNIPTQPAVSGPTSDPDTVITKNEFYDKLFNQVDSQINAVRYSNNNEVLGSGIIQFKTDINDKSNVPDQYILFGEPYPQTDDELKKIGSLDWRALLVDLIVI
jgi:hypothetical protein